MKPYRVYHGVDTDVYIVARSEVAEFVYDTELGPAPPSVKPGSATAHMGGFVEWRPVPLAEAPAGLVAEAQQRGLSLAEPKGGGHAGRD